MSELAEGPVWLQAIQPITTQSEEKIRLELLVDSA